MMTLSAALKLAIDHIEHQAKFITANTVGYSFESLGEDMPGMRAALTRAACKHCDGRGIYESRDIKTFPVGRGRMSFLHSAAPDTDEK
ncbi:MAG: hypothetical protein WDN48_06295 [Pseudolabrys sp.]